jgi:DNA-binding NtrC family response regulator
LSGCPTDIQETRRRAKACAIQSGAIEFLTKPLNEQQLLDAVQAAIEHDRVRRQEPMVIAQLHERFDKGWRAARRSQSMSQTLLVNQIVGHRPLQGFCIAFSSSGVVILHVRK